MNYTWNIDQTQVDDLQVTIMIYDGDTDKLNSNYIGEFTMFFKDEDEIWEFLEQGQAEWRFNHGIMEELRSLTSKVKTDD